MAKDFALDDLVWAKMKGFPPWPAKISEPPDGSSAKSKKPQHFVYFFGTHDVAWILDELIFPHSEEMLANSNNYKKKSTTLQAAIDEIKEESLKVTPKPKKPSTEKTKKETPRSKSPELDSTPSTSKTGKKETPRSKSPPPDSTPSTSKPPKKTLHKKSTEKKRPKKRPAPEEDQDLNSSKVEDYSLLVANVPPNNALAHVAVIPPYEGQVAIATNLDDIYSPETASNKPKKPVPPSKKKLGFIGLGVMGTEMVKHLLKSKHNVTVWNRTIEKCDELVKLGARKAETPADLVRACDIIFCCVSDSEALKAVFFLKEGVFAGLSGGGGSKDIGNKGYVEMTSVDPTISHDISEAVCGEGGRYLEAPMIGSRQQLKDGEILIVASGDRSLYTECDSCFNVWARHAYYHSSDVGSASKLNLLVSMVLGTTYVAVAEALTLVERCEIDPRVFMYAIEDGPLSCPLLVEKGHAMLKTNAEVQHPLKHLQKDLDMAVSLSHNYDQPLMVTAAVNETFKRAKHEYGEKDVSIIRKCYL